MSRILKYTLPFIFLFLAGCSQRFQHINSTLNEAFFGFDDIELSKEKVMQLPYASLYARINGGHQIFMVLAFAETNPETGNTQLKWLSADKAMIVTENGRIVKTLNLPNANLVRLSATNQLSTPNSNTAPWKTQYDWQPDYQYGHESYNESVSWGVERVSSLTWIKNAEHIVENATFSTLKQSMNSEFWVDRQGKVIKSAQWIIPQELYIELTILKPYAGN